MEDHGAVGFVDLVKDAFGVCWLAGLVHDVGFVEVHSEQTVRTDEGCHEGEFPFV